jgi:hypothetical protein
MELLPVMPGWRKLCSFVLFGLFGLVKRFSWRSQSLPDSVPLPLAVFNLPSKSCPLGFWFRLQSFAPSSFYLLLGCYPPHTALATNSQPTKATMKMNLELRKIALVILDHGRSLIGLLFDLTRLFRGSKLAPPRVYIRLTP